MLSDAGSRTIDAYGVRNQEAGGRADGVPYPAFFIVDADGVIRAKLAYAGYRERHTSTDLVEAAKQLDAAP